MGNQAKKVCLICQSVKAGMLAKPQDTRLCPWLCVSLQRFSPTGSILDLRDITKNWRKGLLYVLYLIMDPTTIQAATVQMSCDIQKHHCQVCLVRWLVKLSSLKTLPIGGDNSCFEMAYRTKAKVAHTCYPWWWIQQLYKRLGHNAVKITMNSSCQGCLLG